VIGFRGDLKVLVASRPIDFRRGVHGLVAMVAQALGADPYCGNVFVFRSKRKDRLKLVVWDGQNGSRMALSPFPLFKTARLF
jgi:transposase